MRTAAELLGGPRHRRAVEEVLDAFARNPVPSRRTLRQLDDLLLLLSLERVSDPDGDEPDLFGRIDPADPVVAKLCLLTDGLRHALGAYRQSRDEPALRELDRAA